MALNLLIFSMGNVRKRGDIKHVIKETKKNYLVSEPIYHTKELFLRKYISQRNRRNTNIHE